MMMTERHSRCFFFLLELSVGGEEVTEHARVALEHSSHILYVA